MENNRGDFKQVCLPIDSKKFLDSLNILSINPNLSQNHFVNKIENEKYNNVKLSPLLYEKLYRDKIAGNNFCEGKLMEITSKLNRRNEKLAGGFSEHTHYRFEPCHSLVIGESGGAYLNMQPLRLHSLYGLPYIPASAVKGAMRSAFAMEGTEQELGSLFGDIGLEDESLRGGLVFFDIFPEWFSLSLDVQNPHFRNYYNLKSEPSDDSASIPVFFVCLKKSMFNVIIACEDSKLWKENLDKINKSINVLFSQLGIGSKSSLGYGVSKFCLDTP